MVIDISNLQMQPDQSRKYEISSVLESIPYAGDQLVFDSPLIVNVVVSSAGSVIVVEGEVKADVILACARCLSPFKFHIETEVKGEFHHEKNTASAESFINSEDDIYFFSGDNIDLSDMIAESIVLSLPMKGICSESCKGLCPICGVNLNDKQCSCQENKIDPRLEVLKKFFVESSGKED